MCDNTRTCRAVGYSSEDVKNRVTVLLTCKAGIGQNVSAQVKFADVFSDDDQEVEDPSKMILKIDQKFYGKIGSISEKNTKDDEGKFLSTSQTQVLLKALKGTSKISFVGGGQEWILSSDGAVAVLLKMDDVQGRIGTVSALIKKGMKPESDGFGKFELTIEAVLPHNSLLISGLCLSGAYNEAYGYWVINQQQPYQPKLITTMADGGVEDNEITSAMKDRGLGDSGMCRMIEAGGAWDLPSYIIVMV